MLTEAAWEGPASNASTTRATPKRTARRGAYARDDRDPRACLGMAKETRTSGRCDVIGVRPRSHDGAQGLGWSECAPLDPRRIYSWAAPPKVCGPWMDGVVSDTSRAGAQRSVAGPAALTLVPVQAAVARASASPSPVRSGTSDVVVAGGGDALGSCALIHSLLGRARPIQWSGACRGTPLSGWPGGALLYLRLADDEAVLGPDLGAAFGTSQELPEEAGEAGGW